MARKEINKLNAESIADGISKIQELCRYDAVRDPFPIEEEMKRLMFAMRILIAVPTPKNYGNLNKVLVSPSVTKQVLEDTYFLLNRRYEKLKPELKKQKELEKQQRKQQRKTEFDKLMKPKRYPKPEYDKCNAGHTLVEVYDEKYNEYRWDCPICMKRMEE